MTRANDWLVEKFNKLRFRISFSTCEPQTDDGRYDIEWVKRQIEDLEGGVVLRKSSLIKANLLWKKYSGEIEAIEATEIDGVELIDYLLEEGNKISAIKEYRKIHKCSLREAKDFIETRRLILNINDTPF